MDDNFEGYEYDELSKEAKENALEHFRNGFSCYDDTNYDEIIIEKAESLGFAFSRDKFGERILSYCIGDRAEHVRLHGSFYPSLIPKIMAENPSLSENAYWTTARDHLWFAEAFEVVINTEPRGMYGRCIETETRYEEYKTTEYRSLGLSARESLIASETYKSVMNGVFKDIVEDIEEECLRAATAQYEYQLSDEATLEEILDRDVRFHASGKFFESHCDVCETEGRCVVDKERVAA